MSITNASRSAKRVAVADLSPVELTAAGCVAVGEDGARLGKGGMNFKSANRAHAGHNRIQEYQHCIR